jgi:hypothetical protein
MRIVLAAAVAALAAFGTAQGKPYSEGMCFLEIRQKEGSLTTPLALREQTAGCAAGDIIIANIRDDRSVWEFTWYTTLVCDLRYPVVRRDFPSTQSAQFTCPYIGHVREGR